MEIAILTTIVVGITEVAKRIGAPTKYLPLIALVIGVILGYGTAGVDGIITGIIGGLMACGLWDSSVAVKNIIKK